MAGVELKTKTRDEQYDLIGMLYHTLQAAETCDCYCRDAEKAHDDELARFFHQCQSEQARIAEQAKSLLIRRLEKVPAGR